MRKIPIGIRGSYRVRDHRLQIWLFVRYSYCNTTNIDAPAPKDDHLIPPAHFSCQKVGEAEKDLYAYKHITPPNAKLLNIVSQVLQRSLKVALYTQPLSPSSKYSFRSVLWGKLPTPLSLVLQPTFIEFCNTSDHRGRVLRRESAEDQGRMCCYTTLLFSEERRGLTQ